MKQLTEAQYRALLAQGVLGAETADDLQACAEALVSRAAELGQVLTVEQVPTQPLRMGGHRTVVSIREARALA